MNLFAYDFMQRALIGVLITGVCAPALGIYLVQRRLALIGDLRAQAEVVPEREPEPTDQADV
jgi:ABC-type Mn2+/Zn2+ transport system permease subunit